MATHFERQLEELHVQIITMGSLCEKVISLSNRAIRGDKCIQEIFDTDKRNRHKRARDREPLYASSVASAAGCKRSERGFCSTENDFRYGKNWRSGIGYCGSFQVH